VSIVFLPSLVISRIPRIGRSEPYLVWLVFTARCNAERGYEIARRDCRLSVTIRYRDHLGWNFSKIISRPNSLRPVLSLTPNIGDLVQKEHPQN